MKKTLKTIYNLIPFKREIYSTLKIFWTPELPVFKHLHFKGVFNVQIDKERNFKLNHFGYEIENEIFWKGLATTWEAESLKLWMKLSAESDTILDIGANTGIYSLIAKTINPGSKVYAFEPHPMFFQFLSKNIALNNFDIVPVEMAVSSHDGPLIIEDYSGTTPSLSINSVSLDTFIRQNNIKKIDLIKIDVESHEPQVLSGFSNFLSLFKPAIIVEILSAGVAEKISELVNGLGYLYFNINEKGGIRRTRGVEKSDGFNYLLCQPDIAVKIGLIQNEKT